MADLDTIARRYDPSDPSTSFDYWMIRLRADCIAARLQGARLLELGCATGEFSARIHPFVRRHMIVEGAGHNIDITKERVPNAVFVHSMWEEFTTTVQFSDILMCGALEHVDDPLTLLHYAKSWLLPHGRLHITVPNGCSFHRLVGVEMGLLDEPCELTDGDIAQGHRRNFTVRTLRELVDEAGLTVTHLQPVMLKTVPGERMLGWDWPLIEAHHKLAQRFPDHGAEIYATVEVDASR